jgi:hypothetical protein
LKVKKSKFLSPPSLRGWAIWGSPATGGTSAFRPKSPMPDEDAKPDEVNAECRSTDAY